MKILTRIGVDSAAGIFVEKELIKFSNSKMKNEEKLVLSEATRPRPIFQSLRKQSAHIFTLFQTHIFYYDHIDSNVVNNYFIAEKLHSPGTNPDDDAEVYIVHSQDVQRE